MTLIEALKTNQKVHRPHWGHDHYFQYFLPKTGPHADLVDCDYFVHTESGYEEFSTSIDLYPQDIMAEDYVIVGNP